MTMLLIYLLISGIGFPVFAGLYIHKLKTTKERSNINAKG